MGLFEPISFAGDNAHLLILKAVCIIPSIFKAQYLNL